MPRRKPFSAKQKKAQLQDKRAVKRGDLDPDEVRLVSRTHRAARPGASSHGGGNRNPGPGQNGLTSTRLTSRFIALSPEYLARTRDEAYNRILPRPVPSENGVFPVEIMHRDARVVQRHTGGGVTSKQQQQQRLSCPARPKFRYDMTKKEVEKNEEGYYARWLAETEEVVRAWVEGNGEMGDERGASKGRDAGEGDVESTVNGQKCGQDEAAFKVGGGLDSRSPTWFETNLEVWRQLWRVTETSQIILLLLDARCPPLHLPHSLRSYIQSRKPKKQVVLVLTKSDLVDPAALEGWKRWVKEYWNEGLVELESVQRKRRDMGRDRASGHADDKVGGDREGRGHGEDKGKDKEEEGKEEEPHMEDVQVVCVRSYDTDLLYGDKARHRPDLPATALAELISALQAAHHRLKTPHPRIAVNAERLSSWSSPVRADVDWDLLALGPAANDPPADSGMAGVRKRRAGVDEVEGNEIDEDDDDHEQSEEEQDYAEIKGQGGSRNASTSRERDSATGRRTRNMNDEPLTLGLIGQPNVGKSSLLNALMGETRVRASKTPGKTKHFQTLFWGWKRQVKIVDCPGLVCPSLVGMEVQALCGILPISQIPSLAACITTAAHLMPLEDIFRVPLPPQSPIDEHAHKKTYREGMARPQVEVGSRWTAGAIMEGRALDRGYLTAKGGRPDTNRAANGMMRSLAEGKIRWCFYPPASTSSSTSAAHTSSDTPPPGPGQGTDAPSALATSTSEAEPSANDGRGIWLGDFEHDEADDILSVQSDEDDMDSHAENGSAKRRTAAELLEAQRYVDSDADSEEDSEDDGEAEEAERKGREIDKGFFAALDLGDGAGEEEEESDA